MRVIVASTYIPFIKGGGTMIVDSLVNAIRAQGHDVEAVLIPLYSYWRQLAQQTLAIRALDLTEVAGDKVDQVITIRYPSFAIRHPNKVAWFLHHHRTAYDLWDTPYREIPDDDEGRAFRAALMRSDTLYLKEHQRIYTLSKAVYNRIVKFNQITPTGVCYHPLPDPTPFKPGEFGNYFIYSARLTPIKRQIIAIEAMRFVRSPFKLVLVGTTDMPSYLDEIKAVIARHAVQDKVILTGWVTEEEKGRWTSNACGALYLAYEEDSYGYSSLEAMYAHKPIITFNDSGGTNEVITHRENGLILPPEPHDLAEAMESIFTNRKHTLDMGEQSYLTIDKYGINWTTVMQKMLG